MDNDIRPAKPKTQPASEQNAQAKQMPRPTQNNQVYGQPQANVQPSHTPATPANKPNLKHHKLRKWSMSPNVRGFFSTAQLILGAVLLAFAINTFVFQSYEVVGKSMQPTLQNDDRLVISKVGKTIGGIFGGPFIPKRGDIIVFNSPLNEKRQLVKRVIGLPGEKVIVKNGNITIINEDFPNGFDPDIDYKDSLPLDTSNEIVTEVPDGSIFVSGDNRLGGSSLDSRNTLGTVPLENIIGTLVLRLLPFGEAKFF